MLQSCEPATGVDDFEFVASMNRTHGGAFLSMIAEYRASDGVRGHAHEPRRGSAVPLRRLARASRTALRVGGALPVIFQQRWRLPDDPVARRRPPRHRPESGAAERLRDPRPPAAPRARKKRTTARQGRKVSPPCTTGCGVPHARKVAHATGWESD
jgi:hypothetical protein